MAGMLAALFKEKGKKVEAEDEEESDEGSAETDAAEALLDAIKKDDVDLVVEAFKLLQESCMPEPKKEEDDDY